MKRNLILVVLAICACLLTLGQIPLNAKSIRQFLKEYKEKYEGKTVYVISREEFPAPYEYSIRREISLPVTIRGNTLFITRDSSVVILRKKFDDKYKYKCTKVYLAHKNDLYGKSDAIALNLNYEGRNYPVLIWWDSSMTGRIIEPIEVKTSIGDYKVTIMYPQNIIIAEDDLEEELESLRTQLQITYSSAWCAYRKEEAAKAKREEESRLRREEARVAWENYKKKVEQQKAEEEAKKKQLEEEARMAAEAEEKKREEKAKFIAGLDEKSLKTYSGKMTSTPNWIEDIVKAHGSLNVISGTYSYFSIIEDDEEERIPHGQFLVICSTSDYSMRKYTYEIKGQFNRGKRDGVWTIKAKNNKGEYPYDNYKFQYKNGVLNGDFCFKLGIMDELQRSNVSGTFLNGKLTSISIKDAEDWGPYGLRRSSSITGDVNDKGNPHGKWTKKYESDPRQISYLFYDGCLLYERIKDESTGDVQYKYQASQQIGRPSDLEKVHSIDFNSIGIEGEKYSKLYVEKDLWNVCTNLVKVIYPGFSDWCVKLEKCK